MLRQRCQISKLFSLLHHEGLRWVHDELDQEGQKPLGVQGQNRDLFLADWCQRLQGEVQILSKTFIRVRKHNSPIDL